MLSLPQPWTASLFILVCFGLGAADLWVLNHYYLPDILDSATVLNSPDQRVEKPVAVVAQTAGQWDVGTEPGFQDVVKESDHDQPDNGDGATYDTDKLQEEVAGETTPVSGFGLTVTEKSPSHADNANPVVSNVAVVDSPALFDKSPSPGGSDVSSAPTDKNGGGETEAARATGVTSFEWLDALVHEKATKLKETMGLAGAVDWKDAARLSEIRGGGNSDVATVVQETDVEQRPVIVQQKTEQPLPRDVQPGNTPGYSVHFRFSSARLDKPSKEILYTVLDRMKKAKEERLELHGHSDKSGSEDYNLWLSKVRAQSVAGFLQKRGIDPSRMDILGFGSSHPSNSHGSRAAFALNRRVDIFILGSSHP